VSGERNKYLFVCNRAVHNNNINNNNSNIIIIIIITVKFKDLHNMSVNDTFVWTLMFGSL
jgi:hypothetical protein